MTRVLKRKTLRGGRRARSCPMPPWCKAVQEMESALIDADLGGFLYK